MARGNCVVLSSEAKAQLPTLVERTHFTIPELTRIAYGLLKLMLDHVSNGNRLVIENPGGLKICEVKLPQKKAS